MGFNIFAVFSRGSMAKAKRLGRVRYPKKRKAHIRSEAFCGQHILCFNVLPGALSSGKECDVSVL